MHTIVNAFRIPTVIRTAGLPSPEPVPRLPIDSRRARTLWKVMYHEGQSTFPFQFLLRVTSGQDDASFDHRLNAD